MRHKDSIRRIVALHKGHNPRLYGSVAKGQQTRSSDVDLLVDALPGATMLDIVHMEQQLQRELGLTFEVNTLAGLPRQWRDEVLRQAVAL
nr:nucleotidyltransferase domain-containing protein [Acidovorax sp. D4N7]